MREIAFRFWDKKNEEMVYDASDLAGGYLVEIALDGYVSASYKQAMLDEDEFVLMQYTGLKDKNGKMIFEGDILKAKYYHAFRRWWKDLKDKAEIDKAVKKQKRDVGTSVGEVRFRDGSFGWGYKPFSRFNLEYRKEDRIIRYLEEEDSPYGGDVRERYWDFEVIGNIYENPELLEEKNE